MKALFKRFKEKRAEKRYEKECVKEELKFKKMCDEADRLHNLTGKRYFVVPQMGNNLVIVNNDSLKHHNKTAKKKDKVSFVKLVEMSYYSTGNGKLSRKLN